VASVREIHGSRRAVLAVAISAIALETALLGLIAPLLPEIEERTGAGDAALGLALAAYAIPIMLVSIPVGRLADLIGRRPLLLGGLALTGVGSLLIAFTDSLGVLLLGRVVQGLGSTMSWVAALALVSDLARPGRKGEAIGFALSANSFGAIAGPALGGIAGGAISFEAPFLAVAVIALVMLLAGIAILPVGASAASRRGNERGLLEALLRPRAIAPALVTVVAAAFLGMIDFTVPLDLDRRLGTTATAIGLLFALAALLDAVASPIAGGAGDRRGRRPIVLAGACLVAVSGVLLAGLGTLGGAALGLIVFGVGQSTVFGGAVPWLDDSFGELDRGLAYGGLNLVFAIGYTLGPLAGGWLLESAGADPVYLLMSALSILGGAALAASRKRAHVPPNP
jgi:predicted MFS family arabinose efflux permease